eukprot:TRINITY_DN15591_c0_g1_i1.p1 TRINITY_DN15591_c0_g1~~TRINITY_DN15591_c0_g1_i1.p1  ORF type:complete len:118 (+),score=17.69 TRINITY_DN15591_c0_g1_i1:44-355(+)
MNNHPNIGGVEVEVQTIVADENGNVLSNNTAPIPSQQAASTQPAAAQSARLRRREYLNHLLDLWERYNEIVNGDNPMDGISADIMDQDENTNDDDMEMKGNEA